MRVVSLLFHDVYANEPSESGFISDAANRYKLTVDDFNTQLAGAHAVRSDLPILATRIMSRDNAHIRMGAAAFAITVDDGGASYYTTIAEQLETRGWRGHCFITTDFIGSHGFLSSSQVRALDQRGHGEQTGRRGHCRFAHRRGTRADAEQRQGRRANQQLHVYSSLRWRQLRSSVRVAVLQPGDDERVA